MAEHILRRSDSTHMSYCPSLRRGALMRFTHTVPGCPPTLELPPSLGSLTQGSPPNLTWEIPHGSHSASSAIVTAQYTDSHSLSFSLSLSHTDTHSLSHTQTHSLSLLLSLLLSHIHTRHLTQSQLATHANLQSNAFQTHNIKAFNDSKV